MAPLPHLGVDARSYESNTGSVNRAEPRKQASMYPEPAKATLCKREGRENVIEENASGRLSNAVFGRFANVLTTPYPRQARAFARCDRTYAITDVCVSPVARPGLPLVGGSRRETIASRPSTASVLSETQQTLANSRTASARGRGSRTIALMSREPSPRAAGGSARAPV